MPIQPPKPLSSMTPSELEDWEAYLEDQETVHATTAWDTLNSFRELLNNSHLEAMYFIKKQSKLGNQCPYYLKAKLLFNRDERAAILSLLDQFRKELQEELDDG